jgi:hypothetical protein
VVPISFVGVDSFDKTRFRFIVRHLPISFPERETGGEGCCLTISFDCSALNWDVVLLTVVPTSFAGVDSFHKTRFRFITRHLPISFPERETGGEGCCLTISFDCSALNWDHGLVNCGTNILYGC